MAENSKIEWTDATWNPIRARILADRDTIVGNSDGFHAPRVGWHCEHVSEGCRNCYAERMNLRLGTGLPFKPGHEKDIELFLDEKMLTAPLRWKRPRRIFVCSMTDVFADFVKDEWIDRMFAVMALCPQHTFQVLTKRPGRMREYLTEGRQGAIARRCVDLMLACKSVRPGPSWPVQSIGDIDLPSDLTMKRWPLPNVWLGTSCEDQATADERIPHLLATPAAIRFLSCEPLLGPIDFDVISNDLGNGLFGGPLSLKHRPYLDERPFPTIKWIIVGGESGRHARPMHPDWAHSLRDQCADADVPFFFKQWGEFAPGEIAGDFLNPEKAAKGMSYTGSREGWAEDWSMPDGHIDHEPDVYRIGKKKAGRTLDGVTHDAMPVTA